MTLWFLVYPCMSRSLSMALVDLMLFRVWLGSIVVVTNKEVQRDRSSESIRSGKCTPSSLQSTSAPALQSWINLWSSCRSIANRVIEQLGWVQVVVGRTP